MKCCDSCYHLYAMLSRVCRVIALAILCHITSFYTLFCSVLLFFSALSLFVCVPLHSTLPAAIRVLFTFHGAAFPATDANSPAQLYAHPFDLTTLQRHHLHPCVCGLHFRLRFMCIYVCTTIYKCDMCVHTK